MNVGEAAHIHAENPDGARYNSALTEEGIGSPENGIWLCRICHKRVDDDESRYTVDYLRQLKAEAERNADLAIGIAPTSTLVAGGPNSAALDAVQNLANASTAAITAMLDRDVRQLTDRILAFPERDRLVHLSGYLLGLSPELLGRLNDREFTEIFTHVIQVIPRMITTLVQVGQRLVFETASDFRTSVRPTNAAITPLFGQTLGFAMIHRVYFINQPLLTRQMQPNLVAYGDMSFREQLENNAVQQWEAFQRCLAGYDPRRHAPGSDEECRYRIGLAALEGASSRENFESRLRTAIDTYMPELQSRRDRLIAMLPTDLVAICDASRMLQKPG